MIEKKWEDLEISDDFIFSKVMRDEKLCKKTIEKILKIKIDYIKYIEEQKVIDIVYTSKSVRLDVYVSDENKKVYNIEMQTENVDNLSKRARYYQGMIDMDLIEKGKLYDELNQSFIIFICKFDLFKKGRHIYTFNNICEEDKGVYLKDEATKIFLNSKGKIDDVDEDVKAFLDYVDGKLTDNEFAREIDAAVKKVKANKEWKVEFMTLLMREREIEQKALRKGREEGRQEERENAIYNMVMLCQEAGMSAELVAQKLSSIYKLSESQAKEYVNKYWNK